MSKFDILEQFSNEELKQILRRRGENIRDSKSGEIKIPPNYSLDGQVFIYNSSNKTFIVHIEEEKKYIHEATSEEEE